MATLDRDDTRGAKLQLHRSTWIVLLLAAVFFGLIVVPGQYVLYAAAGDVLGIRGLTMEHGWPWVYLRRDVEPPSNILVDRLPHHGVPWLQSWAWSLEGDVLRWSPWLLMFDLLIIAVILALIAIGMERRHRQRRLWQVSLAEVLTLMLVAGISLGWWMTHQRAARQELQAAEKYSGISYGRDYFGPLLLRRAVGLSRLQPFHRIFTLNVGWSSDVDLKRVPDQFPYLAELRLRTSITDEDLSHVARISRLRYLDLPYAALVTDAGLAQLGNLRALRSLFVSESKQMTGTGVGKLANVGLTRLTLTRTGIDGRALRFVGQLSGLRVLELRDAPIDDNGLRELAKLDKLRALSLSGSEIDGSGLAHLQTINELEDLELSATAVGDDDLEHLEHFRGLKYIGLQETDVSEAGAKRLHERLPGCRVLHR
jgi:hypothetical protein